MTSIVRTAARAIAHIAIAPAIAIVSISVAHAASTETYITDFAKTNNIYTNLNQEFPVTGTGVPGSGVGTANASYLYNPYTYDQTNGVANSDLVGNNGINFLLTSDSAGHDFAEIGGTALPVTFNVSQATNVYLLMGAYDGVNFNVTFTGTNGASETFSNVYVPDFNGGSTNYTSPDLFAQTVYQVVDTGAGGSGNSSNGSFNTYDLTEVGFTLDSSFAGQTLETATISSNGYETLLLGITALGTAGAVPEPGTWALMLVGFGVVGSAMRKRVFPAVAYG